ncbi:tripartite tricarboxylate transporter permease [Nocardioides sp. AE5]|uniref:tripartite tricarboxylate transporter permease n=1 Tax=Nocardioides sp. AE5 TaxID=2962573 RepID=UPI002882BCC5|nr:tripartite tricarboxylate transporter permease [Nocardioides sp. AE5]MDT0202886.1 tripartite tricarboxylate transporter permease [Nocardioides sp. AE5]
MLEVAARRDPRDPDGALGAYAANQQPFDVFLLLVFGLVGFMMRRFSLPVLPLIIGVILGPLMETRFREAFAISGGEVGGLFNETLAIALYVIAALVVVVPLVLRRVRGGSVAESLAEEEELVQR